LLVPYLYQIYINIYLIYKPVVRLAIQNTSYFAPLCSPPFSWTIKGSATCRKGTKEGENLNKYYCGGYTSFFGIGDVNAHVEKTIITEGGDIGKTYKYVI